MPITTAARKAKGRNLQNDSRDILLEVFGKDLKPDQIRGAVGGEQGEDLPMSEEARDVLSGYEFECKAIAEADRGDVYAAIRQAKKRLGKDHRYVAVFRKDRNMEPHAVVLLTEFAQLLRNAHILRKLMPVLQTLMRYTDELNPDDPKVSFVQKELKRFVDTELKSIFTKRKPQ